MGKRYSAATLKVERVQFWWHFGLSLVFTLSAALGFFYYYQRGFAAKEIPTPRDYAAVLVDAISPRAQASVWISTPKDRNVRVDPNAELTLQFYASFETADPKTDAELIGSDEMLKRYPLRYVLVDRMARNLTGCSGASVGTNLKVGQLNPEQRGMAARALPITGLSEEGPNPHTESPSASESWDFIVLTPLSAKADSWSSPLGTQPTSVMDFTCTFKPAAFWLSGTGYSVFNLPAVYGSLRTAEDDSRVGANSKFTLTRSIVAERTSPESQFKLDDSAEPPKLDSNQNLRFEKAVLGGAVDMASVRVWYAVSQFDQARTQDVFLAGVFVSVCAAALMDALRLALEGSIDHRARLKERAGAA